MSTGFHYRPEGRGLLLAWNDPEETPGFKLNFDHAFIEKILTRGVDRLPCLEEAEVNPKRAWAGLYEMTPDHHPVLGPVKALPGFFLANGFSGHGVMHSPATGRILADLIVHGRCDLVDTVPAGLRPLRRRPPAPRNRRAVRSARVKSPRRHFEIDGIILARRLSHLYSGS